MLPCHVEFDNEPNFQLASRKRLGSKMYSLLSPLEAQHLPITTASLTVRCVLFFHVVKILLSIWQSCVLREDCIYSLRCLYNSLI